MYLFNHYEFDVVDTKSPSVSHIIRTSSKTSHFIVSAPVFGDPHVITLDGRNYTFNGLGEYTMINVKDNFFQLQARTKIAKGGGTATVFSGAVAKEHNTSIVQCNLKEEGEKRFDSNNIMIRAVNFSLNQPAHTIMRWHFAFAQLYSPYINVSFNFSNFIFLLFFS